MKSFLLLSFLPKSQDWALLIWRIAVGGLMASLHGWPKLIEMSSRMSTFPDPLGMGSHASYFCTVGAEFLASAMIVAGLCTRWAALGLTFTMGVVFFVMSNGDVGDGELALLFGLTALPLVFSGAGRFSVDAKLGAGA